MSCSSGKIRMTLTMQVGDHTIQGSIFLSEVLSECQLERGGAGSAEPEYFVITFLNVFYINGK